MHACLLHHDLHQVTRGGIGTIYRELGKRLIQRGHRVTLITQRSPQPLRLPGARVITLPRTSDLEAHRRAVTAAVNSVRPDVIDCSSWEAEILHYLQQQDRQHAPVIIRGDLSAATMGAAHLAEDERRLLWLADRVVAVSRFAARDLAQAYGIPVPPVLPNGINRSMYRPGPSRPPRSGLRVHLDGAGRIIRRVPLRDEAARGSVPPWSRQPAGRLQLAWVGKITPMKGWDRLEALIPRLWRIARITVLLGHSPAFCPVTLDGRGGTAILHDLEDDDMPAFYRAADFLLCTSRWEGFGLAIAEALACGTPVLLPAGLGTAPELLAAGGGFTYRDARGLAALLAARPETRGQLPAEFDWDANTEATVGIYNEARAGANRCVS